MGLSNIDIIYPQYVTSPPFILNIQVKDKDMSEKQEHRKRLNAKIEWIRAFEKWLREEPSMIRVFKWRKWKRAKPNYEEFLKEEKDG